MNYILIGSQRIDAFEQIQKFIAQSFKDVRFVFASKGTALIQKARNQEFKLILFENDLSEASFEEILVSLNKEKINKDTPIFYLGDKEITFDLVRKLKLEKFFTLEKKAKNSIICEKILAFLENKLDFDKIPLKEKFKADKHVITPFVQSCEKILTSLLAPKSIRFFNPYRRIEEEKIGIYISGVAKFQSAKLNATLGISFSKEIYSLYFNKVYQKEIKKIDKTNSNLAKEFIEKSFDLLLPELKKYIEVIEVMPFVTMMGDEHNISGSDESQIILVPIDIDQNRVYLQIVLQPKK